MTRLATIAILLGAGCTRQVACRSGTLFVSIVLDGESAQAASLDVTVQVGDKTERSTVTHTPGQARGGLEIRFPGAYPAGQEMTVGIAATVDGTTWMGQSAKTRAGSQCSALSVEVGTPLGDLSSDGASFAPDDLASVDALPRDLTLPSADDLAGASDLAGADLSPDPCGNQCTSSQTCCLASSPSPSPSPSCRDLTQDRLACGSCGHQCESFELCVGSTCLCKGTVQCTNNLVCTSSGCQCQGNALTCGSGCCVTIEAVDVNSSNGSINWTMVQQSGVTIAIVRATDGTTADTKFSANWPAMKTSGLYRGALHYFEPGLDPTLQATAFTNQVSAAGLTSNDFLTVTLDTSGGQSAATLIANLQTFLDAVQSSTDHRPVVTTASSFWNGLAAGSQFGGYPLWIESFSTCPSATPSGWTNWTFWLLSQSATIPGITGMVDLDYFNGTSQDLTNFLADQSGAVSWPAPTLCAP